jgi:hypothetical protein
MIVTWPGEIEEVSEDFNFLLNIKLLCFSSLFSPFQRFPALKMVKVRERQSLCP